ncbi:MAG: magnesium transporter [Chloroflexi bacterium]|nr:magnesium transporter [Chloroflexota bacterium]
MSTPAPSEAVDTIIAEAEETGDLSQVRSLVASAIEAGDVATVSAILTRLRAPDRVDVFESFDLGQQSYLMTEMDDGEAADILEELDDEDAAEVAATLHPLVLAPIIDLMATDEAADILGDLSSEQAEQTLAEMDDAAEGEVRTLMGYDDETAGGRMIAEFVALHAEETVAESIERLRAMEPDEETTYYLYVVDAAGRLAGILSLRQLVVAKARQRIGDLMAPDVLSVSADADQEEAARLMARYDLLALPVVDQEGRLLGVITHDDLVDVLEEEATEDMYRLVGLQEEERQEDSIGLSVRRRLPWLAINLGTQLLLVTALVGFEATLDRLAALSILFPLVTGQGGNVGAQAMTFVVRSIALGEIERGSQLRLLVKEATLGLINGMAIGLLAGLIAFVVVRDPQLALRVAGVMFLAMAMNLTAGGLAGVAIPLGLRRLGIDPAVASSVFVTTVTDTLGVIFFLGLFNLVVRP